MISNSSMFCKGNKVAVCNGVSVYQVASIVYSVSLIWQWTANHLYSEGAFEKPQSSLWDPFWILRQYTGIQESLLGLILWGLCLNCPWSNPDSEAKNLDLGFRVQDGPRIQDSESIFSRSRTTSNAQQCKKYSIVYGFGTFWLARDWICTQGMPRGTFAKCETCSSALIHINTVI